MPLLLHPALIARESASGVPSIIRNSPFLPPGFEAPGQPGKAAPDPSRNAAYEFRGVYQLDGRYFFNLYNTRDRKGSWIGPGESGSGPFEIIDFNEEENALTVAVDGQTLNLALVETSNKPMPVRTAPAATRSGNRETAVRQTRRPVRRRVIRPASRNRAPSSENTTRRRPVSRNP